MSCRMNKPQLRKEREHNIHAILQIKWTIIDLSGRKGGDIRISILDEQINIFNILDCIYSIMLR